MNIIEDNLKTGEIRKIETDLKTFAQENNILMSSLEMLDDRTYFRARTFFNWKHYSQFRFNYYSNKTPDERKEILIDYLNKSVLNKEPIFYWDLAYKVN